MKTKYDRARIYADKEIGNSPELTPEELIGWDIANEAFLEGFNTCENIGKNGIIHLMKDYIEKSPTDFIYQLDKAIKEAHVSGTSIDKVQRYYISCLLKSNGTVLTEPVYFEPL